MIGPAFNGPRSGTRRSHRRGHTKSSRLIKSGRLQQLGRTTEPDRETELTTAATEPEPIVSRPKSRKRKSASAGPKLIGKSPQRDGSTSHDQADWPSVEEILATHRIRPNSPATPRTVVKSRRSTTDSNCADIGPRTQSMDTPPLARVAAGHGLGPLCGGGRVRLSWKWGGESFSASMMTNRLILADASSAAQTASGVGCTASRNLDRNRRQQHLAHWAIYLNRFERKKDDPARGYATFWIGRLKSRRLNPTARLALAQLEPSASETAARFAAWG